MRKVAVIGLDCAAPLLIFERYRAELPNLAALMADGTYGRLRSCHPPITVPAWASLFSGRDPGELGIYGFRNRRTASDPRLRVSTADEINAPSVWDAIAREGGQSILLGIPPSYPARAIDGYRVGCLLTPDAADRSTWPPALAAEIDALVPDYTFDVADFRDVEPLELVERLRRMTAGHFRLARHLLQSRPWDFFAMVEIGPDRLHHALWRYLDPSHPAYAGETAIEAAAVDYYRFLDRCIGELLDVIGSDAVVVVASDHGAQPMHGGICINAWLAEHGYLVLRESPTRPVPLQPDWVDWTRTRVWAEGGYYARVFVNQRGREVNGTVEPDRADALLDEVAAGLAGITDEDGAAVGVAAHRPRELYRATHGVPPDLLVYFDDLAWRSVGSVGHDGWTVRDNDTGADDANHAWDGIFVARDPRAMPFGEVESGFSLLDVAASLLRYGDVADPGVLPGRPIELSGSGL